MGETYHIPDGTICCLELLYWANSQKKYLELPCSLTDNIISTKLTPNVLTAQGKLIGKIKLEKDTSIIRTKLFELIKD